MICVGDRGLCRQGTYFFVDDRIVMFRIRPELPADHGMVRVVHRRAFGQPQEGELVDVLRASPSRRISLVAEIDEQIVGHIYFSPVTVEPSSTPVAGMGLAPLAVLPEYQRQGIGAQLVWHGLEECRRLEQDCVVVLGHPEYYHRFGFVSAASKNLRCEYPVPPDAFMVLELRAATVENCKGLVKYRPEFASL